MKMTGALVNLDVYVGAEYVVELNNGDDFTINKMPGTYQLRLDTITGTIFKGKLTVPDNVREMSVEIVPKTFGVKIGDISYR